MAGNTGRRLTDSERQAILQKYADGLSIRAVAKVLNVGERTVATLIKKSGMSRNDFCGTKNPFYGKTHSEELRLQISKQNTGRVPPNKGKSKYLATKYFPGLLVHKWFVNAQQRNIVWEIDNSDIDRQWELQGGRCALTGNSLSTNYSATKHTIASLDRIDSSLGYIKGNIQFISGMLNICKNTLHDDDFITLCRKVATHVNG